MSIGTDRVRLDFNPGGNPIVRDIKRRVAELIDICEGLKAEGDPRSAAIAMTEFETACMYAVKAATTGKE